jgi:hypothetical protein
LWTRIHKKEIWNKEQILPNWSVGGLYVLRKETKENAKIIEE